MSSKGGKKSVTNPEHVLPAEHRSCQTHISDLTIYSILTLQAFLFVFTERDREGCFCFQMRLEQESRRVYLVLLFICHLSTCLPAVIMPTRICTSQLEQEKFSKPRQEGEAHRFRKHQK